MGINGGNSGNGNGSTSSPVANVYRLDPGDFIVPASDHQGHSERIWARVQPLHDRMADKIVQSRVFPFRTKGDLFRWGIVRAMKHLLYVIDENQHVPRTFMQQADAIQEMLRDELYIAEYMGLFDNLQKVVNQHMAMGAPGEAIRVVAQVKFKLEAIEGEPVWRAKLLLKLKEQFGQYLNQRGIGLHAFNPDQAATAAAGDGTTGGTQ